MDLERLAGMVAQAQTDKAMSDYRLEHEIGVLPDGSVFNAKQIGRWKQGLRVQPIPRAVVARLIEILSLDPPTAWASAGLWPPDLDLATYRELRKVSPPEPALAHATGGSESPPARSLRKARTPPRTEGRQRDISWYRFHAGQRGRRSELGQVAA